MNTMLDMPKSSKPSQTNRTGTPLGIRIDDEIMDAVTAHVESLMPRTTLTAVVEHALLEYLEKRGAADAKRPRKP